MIVKCTNCDAAFTVADEKVKGKIFAFDCPKCNENIVVDNKLEVAVGSVSSVGNLEPEKNIEQPVQSTEDSVMGSNEDMDFDIPDFDIDSGDGLGSDSEEEFSEKKDDTAQEGSTENSSDEFNIDDNIDFGELIGEDIANVEDTGEEQVESGDSVTQSKDDEDVTLDLDSLDIDFDEVDTLAEEEVSTEEQAAVNVASVENDNIEEDFSFEEENENVEFSSDIAGLDDISKEQEENPAEEDVSLDLDSLDIDLEESFDIKEGEDFDTGVDVNTEAEHVESVDESRLSLDDVGISIDQISDSEAEKAATPQSAPVDDGDSLNLEDAGLTLDEIETSPEISIADSVSMNSEVMTSQEDISVEDVAPELSDIPESPLEESMELDYDDNLPELDMEKYEEEESEAEISSDIADNVLLDIEAKNDMDESFTANEAESYSIDESGKGFINFSVDYSLKYSRLKALLRLLMLYGITLIPHMLIYMLYSLVSGIVGWLNWMIILFSGDVEADFVRFQEKTLRYFISIQLTMTDVIEEKPLYAGDRDIDYPLQMDVAVPANYSRWLAFMRLSWIGIMLITLPHLILLSLLTFGVFFIGFIGLIALIINQRWPSVLFDFMVRYFRYQINVIAFIIGLIDSYPSFRFD